MSKGAKTIQPFMFYTRLHLSESTGLRAFNLNQLLDFIKQVPDSSIYHHTHRFLQQHQYLNPEPPNDFAYWISEAIGEDELAEKLASIDTVRFSNIGQLRGEIIKTIEKYLADNPFAASKSSRPDEGFYFIKSVNFVFPSNYVAKNLAEFVNILRKITFGSIYFHVFEARLRLEKKTNDFSFWLETSCGEKDLADKISALDPYTFTLEDLRKKIIAMVGKRLKEKYGKNT